MRQFIYKKKSNNIKEWEKRNNKFKHIKIGGVNINF